MNGAELETKLIVIELDDGTLPIKESKRSKEEECGKLDEEEFIKKYTIQCKRCNRNFILEYDFEFVCYICGFNIEKTKSQLTKIQRKKILIT